MTGGTGENPSRRKPGRRVRRLRWTLIGLAVTAAVGGAIGIGAYWASRPKAYEPGSEDKDITSVLRKDIPADAPSPKLVDVTREAGIADFQTFVGARTSQLPEDMGPGMAWGDFDNDGDEDLFLVSAGGPLTAPETQLAPSSLFENRGDGTFQRVVGFAEPRIHGMGAAWGDVENDGWLDLLVTGYDALQLYRNRQGKLSLDKGFSAPKGFWATASFADYDQDGDLDLYVCGYVQYKPSDGSQRTSTQYGSSVPYTLNPSSYEPEQNLLFRNRGDGRFDEVAEKAGVSNPEGRSLSAIWHDFNADGWLDLYVANDVSDNVLWLNRRGKFEDISHAAWVADYRGAMGLAAADWNRDGDDDLFITHWLAQENALYDSLSNDMKGQPGAGSDGLRFMDIADAQGLGQVALQSVGWGAEFVDLDADGWLDLVVANGSTIETEETPKRLRPQPMFAFWGNHGERFYDLAPLDPILATPRVARGLSMCDYDRDGDMDILVSTADDGVRLFRNDMQSGNWAEFRIRTKDGSGPGRDGTGATVIVTVGGVRIRRSLSPASYLSQSSRVIHVGLGDATRIDRLELLYPGEKPTIYTDLATNTAWELTVGDTTARQVGKSAAGSSAKSSLSREQVVEFWRLHRAGMDAIKRDKDFARAVGSFRQALEIDPNHEDARYYLGNALAEIGDIAGALNQFEALTRVNPSSHRGFARHGTLLAIMAKSQRDLDTSQSILEKALALNPEETGALLTLGEIALMRGDLETSRQRLEWAAHSNPRATGSYFLRAYIAWKAKDAARSTELLRKARETLGPDWKPEGTTAEGDVIHKVHDDTTPLSPYWDSWDGKPNPSTAFVALERALRLHF